jgi:hypothetical protein
MIMIINRFLTCTVVGATLLFSPVALNAPVLAAGKVGLEQYLGNKSPQFADPAAAVDAFKAALAADDVDGLAKLLGLDPAKLKGANGIMDRFEEIRQGAAKLLSVGDEGDLKIIRIGDKVWPFPFPIAKDADGKWAFDTKAGIQEIINRRVGENELQAIATAHAYVDAQRNYAAADHDGDGVLEYAQKLVSSEGKTDGLYWPIELGQGESPAGPFISQAALGKAKTQGYFGYHFRILTGQGNQVAGGRYDYVINGNMIAGFALIAWPVNYAQSGVKTFEVSHAGIVYEKDLGPNTEAIANGIVRFDPDKSWDVVTD